MRASARATISFSSVTSTARRVSHSVRVSVGLSLVSSKTPGSGTSSVRSFCAYSEYSPPLPPYTTLRMTLNLGFTFL
eukprot:31227-Pelagococcus_subviridis.AAC.5